MADTQIHQRSLGRFDHNTVHEFITPVKRINDGDDVTFFLSSKAYTDIMTFIFQLNASMFPRKSKKEASGPESITTWNLKESDVPMDPIVQKLAKLLQALGAIVEEAPPDTGPRRFGNVSFRKWHDIVRERLPELLDQFIPPNILALSAGGEEKASAKTELETYLLGSFGSSQRLDYGTGHELSFLAFLGCLWKLGAFPQANPGVQERAIVIGVIEPYLELVRRLILTYTLEPAGSHGVWGLDDHSFLPYIFGSAQLSPAISTPADIATEGSLPDAPNSKDVANAAAVERERKQNMYFSAIGFIYDVKKGPFWEHSPILFDISGVPAGWAKINKGMLKMYNAEVLSKFPVVQHFPFGSLFRWEKDPEAMPIAASIHTTNQPSKAQSTAQSRNVPLRDPMQEGTRAPWSSGTTGMPPGSGTAAPWATSRLPARAAPAPVSDGPNQPTRAPWASSTRLPPPASSSTTAAPWAKPGASVDSLRAQSTVPTTRAPWADKKPQD